MIQYKYNCIDKSILLPFFKKYYVEYFFKFVPRCLTANIITIISTGFIFATLPIVYYSNVISLEVQTILLVFCINAYTVGDHLDGMQAKRTNTSTPLGEFLDHYLDVFNGAILFYVITIYLAPIPELIFYFLGFFS